LLQHAGNAPEHQLQQFQPPEKSAGVQSSATLLLAVRGRIPTFDAAIFAECAALEGDRDALTALAQRLTDTPTPA
jgi:hypothetical protein